MSEWYHENENTAGNPPQEEKENMTQSQEAPVTEQPTPSPAPTYADGWYRSGPVNVGGQTPTPVPPPASQWQTPQKPPRKNRHTGLVVALAVVGSVAILVLAVLVAFAIGQGGVVPETDRPSTEQNDDTVNQNAPSISISDWADDDGGLTAVEIINKNIDSTVVINAYQVQTPSYGYGFGAGTLTQVGQASGVVLTKDGYIITNWHVVTDEKTGEVFDQIEVATNDGTVYEDAKVIGADQSTDLAVIKVDAQELAPAEFGDSSKLVMGARVVALGNAGGLEWSASQGIISGLARDVYEDTGYSIKCLQTDAAINPGNSGGPLINNAGQVIGINSAKIAAEGYEGLGFSIPINEAKDVLDDLLKYGYVKGRVQLGINGYSVNSNGYAGFVIQSIAENSPMAETKAREGDLITAVDGVEIDGYGALRAELAKHKPGETVTLSLIRLNTRTGKETTFTVTCKLTESKQ
jgi:serine protease Do